MPTPALLRSLVEKVSAVDHPQETPAANMSTESEALPKANPLVPMASGCQRCPRNWRQESWPMSI